MNKGILYANGVVSSLSQNLLTKEFFSRLCECKNKNDFLSIFDETQFNSSQEDLTINEKMDLEILKLVDFVKKESPDDTFTQFFLLPFDYENILSFCKCVLLDLDYSKYTTCEGNYSIEEIKNNILNKNYKDFKNDFIKKALLNYEKLSKAENIEGWEIEYAFKKEMYANLNKISSKNSFLNELTKNLITIENISVAMRAKTQFELESQLILLGKLNKEQLLKIFKKNKDVLNEVKDEILIEFVDLALKEDLKNSCVEFEREKQALFINYFYKNKDKIETICPFAYYIYKKYSDIKNVRLAYSYVENGLNTEIKKRILNCER